MFCEMNAAGLNQGIKGDYVMSDIFDVMLANGRKQELARILDCNRRTAEFGLCLSEEEAERLLAVRERALKDSGRVEFGGGILPDLIAAFCDSQYINQEDYEDILAKLQDIFYSFKNETMDEVTDGELLDFMRYEFEGICFGDLEYLRDTCMERFARASRAGEQFGSQKRLRDEYAMGRGGNGYERLEEEKRWDEELYRMKLDENW